MEQKRPSGHVMSSGTTSNFGQRNDLLYSAAPSRLTLPFLFTDLPGWRRTLKDSRKANLANQRSIFDREGST